MPQILASHRKKRQISPRFSVALFIAWIFSIIQDIWANCNVCCRCKQTQNAHTFAPEHLPLSSFLLHNKFKMIHQFIWTWPTIRESTKDYGIDWKGETKKQKTIKNSFPATTIGPTEKCSANGCEWQNENRMKINKHDGSNVVCFIKTTLNGIAHIPTNFLPVIMFSLKRSCASILWFQVLVVATNQLSVH